jgi:hypothetical protein
MVAVSSVLWLFLLNVYILQQNQVHVACGIQRDGAMSR